MTQLLFTTADDNLKEIPLLQMSPLLAALALAVAAGGGSEAATTPHRSVMTTAFKGTGQKAGIQIWRIVVSTHTEPTMILRMRCVS